MAQWINLNGNNRSVIVHRYSTLSEKAGPVLLPLVGFMAGRLAGWQTKCRWISKFLKFSTGQTICIFTSFNIIIILLYYYLCISTVFSQLKLILRCVLRHKIIRSPFFPCQSLLLITIILNDYTLQSVQLLSPTK